MSRRRLPARDKTVIFADNKTFAVPSLEKIPSDKDRSHEQEQFDTTKKERFIGKLVSQFTDLSA